MQSKLQISGDNLQMLMHERALWVEEKQKLAKTISTIEEDRRKFAGDVDRLSKQVREQNEADLFFVSAKICFELLQGKPKEDAYIVTLRENQIRAQQQMAAMPSSCYSGMQQTAYNPLGRLFGL